MKLNSKGQVTIPAQLRREMNLREGDEVNVVLRDGQLVIIRVDGASSSGERLIAHMRGRADGGLTTDELMALTRGD